MNKTILAGQVGRGRRNRELQKLTVDCVSDDMIMCRHVDVHGACLKKRNCWGRWSVSWSVHRLSRAGRIRRCGTGGRHVRLRRSEKLRFFQKRRGGAQGDGEDSEKSVETSDSYRYKMQKASKITVEAS
jgi:hypothetical protein